MFSRMLSKLKSMPPGRSRRRMQGLALAIGTGLLAWMPRLLAPPDGLTAMEKFGFDLVQLLEPEQRNGLLAPQNLTLSQRPEIKVQTDADIITTLSKVSLSSLRDRVVAMPSRFQHVQQDAAKLMEPKVTFVSLPRRTLKSEVEVEEWLSETKSQLLKALSSGPVGVQ